jgi:uncharacterized protein YjbI with pentapeptide repeats
MDEDTKAVEDVEYPKITKKDLFIIIKEHKKLHEKAGEDVEQLNLEGLNLEGLNLSGFEIVNANMQKVNLSFSNLKNANLTNTNLQKANLAKSNLQDACLYNSDLQAANLKKANLQNVEFNKANLQNASLQGANLQYASLLDGANLKEANLWGADLQKANLNGANLQKAILYNANLQEANLTGADLKNSNFSKIKGLSTANIKYANLEGVIGLLGNEFAQADVTGTKLPDDIKEFKALEIVKETSQNARKIFFAMLLGCVYSWLTIATTTDVKLLTNTASSPLPIIGTEIPIAWFYVTAPLVLMCIYFYFHLYLIKLWEALSGLPAIFPDGKRLDEIAYPWLLNGLVRRHFKLLKKDRPFIAHVQEWIIIFLSWWVVPITMIAFWLRFIPRHDWWGTGFHIGLIVISIGFSIIFYRLCAIALQRKEKINLQFKNLLRDKRFYNLLSFVTVCIIFVLLSYYAINGVYCRPYQPNYNSIKHFVINGFLFFGYNVFADVSEKTVSEIPADFWQIAKSERLDSVKGANLKGRNLNNAIMIRAFLVKADFRGASLKSAYLSGVRLQKADLYGVHLQKADLSGANLEKANLKYAHLQKANLEYTYLFEADLGGANLQEANLKYARLQRTKLDGVNLQEADLSGANLKEAYLWCADLQRTMLWRANLQGAILIAARFEGANLYDANLQGANLANAHLQKANLKVTQLQEVSFESADLIGAKNLTIEQLSKVKTLYQAKLDNELLEQVKKCCPHLLEKPKEEKERTE